MIDKPLPTRLTVLFLLILATMVIAWPDSWPACLLGAYVLIGTEIYVSPRWDRSIDPVVYEYLGPCLWPISMPIIGIYKMVKTIKARRSSKFLATARIVKR